ncbi:MAG: hypothetical protein ACXV3C_06895, partial [Actinomycetes bacterium]
MLHVDTLVGEGPAAHDPGELRGLSSPVSVDAESAAELARDEIGAGAATCVLLTDGQGAVERLVRLATAPAEGWTRSALVAAVRQALPRLPAVQAEGYAPTVHIAEH